MTTRGRPRKEGTENPQAVHGRRPRPDQFMPVVEGVYSIDRKGGDKWFIVVTNPGCEDKVSRGMVAKKVTHYVPRTKKWKPQTKRQRFHNEPKKDVARPLMGRYAFAAVAPESDDMPERLPIGRLRAIEGVHSILRDEKGPVVVSADLVEEIHRREQAGEFDRTIRRQRGRKDFSAPEWAAEGGHVVVKRGPFRSLTGIVQEVLSGHRVKVAITLFDRKLPVDLEIEHLAAA